MGFQILFPTGMLFSTGGRDLNGCERKYPKRAT